MKRPLQLAIISGCIVTTPSLLSDTIQLPIAHYAQSLVEHNLNTQKCESGIKQFPTKENIFQITSYFVNTCYLGETLSVISPELEHDHISTNTMPYTHSYSKGNTHLTIANHMLKVPRSIPVIISHTYESIKNARLLPQKEYVNNTKLKKHVIKLIYTEDCLAQHSYTLPLEEIQCSLSSSITQKNQSPFVFGNDSTSMTLGVKDEIKPKSYSMHNVSYRPVLNSHKGDLISTVEEYEVEVYHTDETPLFSNLLVANEKEFSPLEYTVIEKSDVVKQTAPYSAFSTETSFNKITSNGIENITNECSYSTKVAKKGDKYAFSIRVSPYSTSDLPRVAQHHIFLVDQTSSVSKNRFESFKKSILRALPYIHEDDTFNVIIANGKYEYLSREPMHTSKISHDKTRNFLANIRYGSLIPSKKIANTFSTLYNKDLIPANSSIVYMSDSGAHTNKNTVLEQVHALTKVNRHNTPIHTIAVGNDTSLYALKKIAEATRGCCIHSTSYAAIPRKVAKMIKKVSSIVGNKAHAEIVYSSDTASILDNSSSICKNGDYVVYGEADTLSDIDLFIQAECNDQYLHIRKKIDLREAIPESFSQIQASKNSIFLD